jgi:hypothetical protein
MKLKTLIGTIALAASTCFGATDAEIKEMLAKKDYMSATVKITTTQLTNGVVTASDMNGLVDAAIKTNVEWKVVFLAKHNMIDSVKTIALFENVRMPDNMMQVAFDTKNEDVMADTWAKVLDMPETTGQTLYNFRGSFEFRDANFELFKRSSEKILKNYPIGYIHYTFNHQYKHPEYKDWSISCLNNIKDNMFISNLPLWLCLYTYDHHLIKTGFIKTNAFYFENAFSNLDVIIDKNVNRTLYYIYYCEFKDKAIEVMAKTITKSDVAYKFSKHIDSKENNKEMTKRMYSVIAKDIHLGLDAAKYLNDVDKVINILLVAKEELSSEELDSVIPMINALDADYRAADIVKALRNINARYTLKLYDNRETWEPVLSKIRALIDVRQM